MFCEGFSGGIFVFAVDFSLRQDAEDLPHQEQAASAAAETPGVAGPAGQG